MNKQTIEPCDIDVLSVEDDLLLNRVMVVQLTKFGYSVRSATSGQQALAMIGESLPSILVLDVDLPDLTGYEVVERLRVRHSTRALPLIVHTSLDLTAEEQKRLELGHTKFLTKSTAFSERLPELLIELLK